MDNILWKDNFYSQYFLSGTHQDTENSYPYLKKSNFTKLKSLIDRVTIITEEMETHIVNAPKGHYSKGNFSDIFEYMDTKLAMNMFNVIGQNFAKGGRIAFWNLYVKRSSMGKIPNLKQLLNTSKDLKLKDRVWFYESFFVEEII